MKYKLHLRLRVCLVFVLTFVLVFVSLLTPVAAGGGVLTRPRDYRLVIVTSLTNDDVVSSIDVHIKVPLMSWNGSPYQVVVDEEIEPQPEKIEVDSLGNRYGLFYFEYLGSGETVSIKQTYLIKNYSYYTPESPAYGEVQGIPGPQILAETPGKEFLEPQELVESNDPAIIAKSQAITKGVQDEVEKARRIFAFVNTYITYDPSVLENGQNIGALAALRLRRGVCFEYASLFVALARAAKIPARIVEGYWLSNALVPPEGLDLRSLRHAWAEFYVEKLGWVPVEPTMDYRINGVKTVPYDYFGALPKGEHLVFAYGSENRTSVQYWNGHITLSSQERLFPASGLPSFTDTYGHWAQDTIEALLQVGAIHGYSDGSFRPDKAVTRAEFVTLLLRAMGIKPEAGGIGFPDTAGQWAEGYIAAARRAGLVSGYEDGTFRPDSPIQRAEMAKILAHALHLVPSSAGNLFSDIPAGYWAAGDIIALAQNGLISGFPDHTFRPQEVATRAQVATVISGALVSMR